MKRIAISVIALLLSLPVFAQRTINEAQLVGLERTYTARQAFDIVGLPACASDPPVGACVGTDVCVDVTNDNFYTCQSTAWESVGGAGAAAATAIQSCAADPPVGACVDEDVCIDDTNNALFVCVGVSWVKTNAADADTLDTLDSLAFLKADGTVISTGTQSFDHATPIIFGSTGGIQAVQWGCDTTLECTGVDHVLNFSPESATVGVDVAYNFKGSTSGGDTTLTLSSPGLATLAVAGGAASKVQSQEIESATLLFDGDVSFEHTTTDFIAIDPVITWGTGSTATQTLTFSARGDSDTSEQARYDFDNKASGGTQKFQMQISESGITNTSTTALAFNATGSFSLVNTDDIKFGGFVGSKAIIMNQFTADIDFRVHGVGTADVLFVDATLKRVGVMNATPATALDVTGTLTADGISCPNCITLQTETSGNFISSATLSQGLLMTGTENASIGFQVCAANEVMKNVGGATWACAADATGGSTNSFETWNVAAGTDPVADSATDTVNITSDAEIVITGTAASDTIDFAFRDCAANEVLARNAGDTAWECQSKAATCTMVFMSNADPGNGADTFGSLQGSTDAVTGTEAEQEQLFPFAFTLHTMYAEVSTAPDPAPPTGGTQSHIITLRKNGGDEVAIQCTISEAATTCNDTTGSVTFAAGDSVAWEFDHSASAPLDATDMMVSVCGEPQ